MTPHNPHPISQLPPFLEVNGECYVGECYVHVVNAGLLTADLLQASGRPILSDETNEPLSLEEAAQSVTASLTRAAQQSGLLGPYR